MFRKTVTKPHLITEKEIRDTTNFDYNLIVKKEKKKEKTTISI